MVLQVYFDPLVCRAEATLTPFNEYLTIVDCGNCLVNCLLPSRLKRPFRFFVNSFSTADHSATATPSVQFTMLTAYMIKLSKTQTKSKLRVSIEPKELHCHCKLLAALTPNQIGIGLCLFLFLSLSIKLMQFVMQPTLPY